MKPLTKKGVTLRARLTRAEEKAAHFEAEMEAARRALKDLERITMTYREEIKRLRNG